jgi:hypothetical protein
MIKAKIVVDKVSWPVDWTSRDDLTEKVAGKIGLCVMVIVRV